MVIVLSNKKQLKTIPKMTSFEEGEGISEKKLEQDFKKKEGISEKKTSPKKANPKLENLIKDFIGG